MRGVAGSGKLVLYIGGRWYLKIGGRLIPKTDGKLSTKTGGRMTFPAWSRSTSSLRNDPCVQRKRSFTYKTGNNNAICYDAYFLVCRLFAYLLHTLVCAQGLLFCRLADNYDIKRLHVNSQNVEEIMRKRLPLANT